MARQNSKTVETPAAAVDTNPVATSATPEKESVERGYIVNGQFVSSFPDGPADASACEGAGLRIGETIIPVLFAELNARTLSHVLAQGIRHMLGDATANAKAAAAEPDETRTQPQIAVLLATRKADALKAGDIRTSGGGDDGTSLKVNKSFDSAWVGGYARHVISQLGAKYDPAKHTVLFFAENLRRINAGKTEAEADAYYAGLRASPSIRAHRDAIIAERAANRTAKPRVADKDVDVDLSQFV